MKRSLLALVFAAPLAFAAQRPVVNSSSAVSAGDYTSSATARSIAFGVQHVITSDGEGINEFHAMFEIMPRLLIGGGFGFAQEFDNAIFSADARYNMVKHGPASLYANLVMGWGRKSAGTVSANGFLVAALFGFNYALTDNLQLNAGYGFQMGFGDAFAKKVSFTNTDPVGNFGIHWYF